jgi:glutamyl-tRNA reductase
MHICYYLDHTSFDALQLASLSAEIKKNKPDLLKNALLICTCHRIEAYFPFNPKEDPIMTLLGHKGRIIRGKEKLHSRLTGICCGLQSKILGEKFIYHQVEQAVELLQDDHPMKAFGDSVLAEAKRVRKKYDFFAAEDYEGISLGLINKLADHSKLKTLIVIGAGMLARQVAFYAGDNHFNRVVMVSRVAKKFRKKNRNTVYPFHVCSMNTLPENLCDSPFHCFIATTNISQEYQTLLLGITGQQNCKSIIDMSSLPAFQPERVCEKLYITMYDDQYLHEVDRSNSTLLPIKHLVETEISRSVLNSFQGGV